MMKGTFLISIILTITSCGLDCIDKKTGLHKSSRTLDEAKKNGVYEFEMTTDKTKFLLDSGKAFGIKNAWIEKTWKYECIDNKAVIQLDSYSQFVIESIESKDLIFSNYWLSEENGSGPALGSILDFKYDGQDTLILTLTKDKAIIDTLKFIKKVSR